jgi:hypothetical protein
LDRYQGVLALLIVEAEPSPALRLEIERFQYRLQPVLRSATPPDRRRARSMHDPPLRHAADQPQVCPHYRSLMIGCNRRLMTSGMALNIHFTFTSDQPLRFARRASGLKLLCWQVSLYI